jgi:hypothetical protein
MSQPVNLYDKNGRQLDFDEMDGIDIQDHMITEDNPVPTKKPYLAVTGHNAVAIRDTANSDVTVDVSKILGEKVVVVTNTTNQQINVNVYAKGTNYSYALALGATAQAIAAGAAIVLSSNQFAFLKSPVPQLIIRASAATAPTSGSISTFVEGVQA